MPRLYMNGEFPPSKPNRRNRLGMTIIAIVFFFIDLLQHPVFRTSSLAAVSRRFPKEALLFT